jgi:cysteine sulfinate desulfinase/cysteine desulfurase-like protein
MEKYFVLTTKIANRFNVFKRIAVLRDRLLAGFVDMEAVVVNGDEKQRIPGNLNISFNYVEGESLMMAINCASRRTRGLRRTYKTPIPLGP